MQYPNVARIREMMDASRKDDPNFFSWRKSNGEVQQYLLYAASNDVFFGAVTDGERGKLPKGITIPEAQELLLKVRMSEYARTHWPKFAAGDPTTIDNDTSAIESSWEYRLLHNGQKYGGAYTDDQGVVEGWGGAQIHLADNGFAMQPQVVLHELGHAVEAFERPNFRGNGEAHGAAFARTNIELIREFMSPEKAKELEKAFQFAGVEVAPASQSQPHKE